MADEIVTEKGHCDEECFGEDFIDCDGTDCTIGTCFQGQFTIPEKVPIKTLLKGSSNTPWVKLWFDTCCGAGETCNPNPDCIPSDDTLITTGNISQAANREKCTAAIQAFQYSWGAVGAGNTCKITIHDEAGGS